MQTLDDAAMIFSRQLHRPLPELLLLAGYESREGKTLPETPLGRLAHVQWQIVQSTSRYYSQRLNGPGIVRADCDGLCATAASLDRGAVRRSIADTLLLIADETGVASDAVDAFSYWANYVEAAGLAQAIVRKAGEQCRHEADSPPTSEFRGNDGDRDCCVVPACLWRSDGDDPMTGIAGWMTPSAQCDAWLAAVVADGDEALTDRRRQALELSASIHDHTDSAPLHGLIVIAVPLLRNNERLG